jgi:hypothetical protein
MPPPEERRAGDTDRPTTKGRVVAMEAKRVPETKFLTVVDTFAGYCQVCHAPHVVGRIAVAGWEHHGTICSQCLSGLADEVQRRGKSLASANASRNGHGEALVGIGGGNGNGNGYSGDPLRH